MLTSPRAIYALLLAVLLSPSLTHAVSVGEPAPFFKLDGVENSSYTLNDFKNKIVFVNFWASWCSPCRKELPLLDELQTRYNDFIVLAINIDSERESAEKFLKKFDIKSLILFDPATDVVSKYGAIAMPTSYILDQNGVIRYSHYGFNAETDPTKWDTEIRSLLGRSK